MKRWKSIGLAQFGAAAGGLLLMLSSGQVALSAVFADYSVRISAL